MPNPDGTHTAEEHRRAILDLARPKVARGMSPEEAIAVAGEEWRSHLKADGDRKIDAVLKFLGKRDVQ